MTSPTTIMNETEAESRWQGDPELTNPDLIPTPVEERNWTWCSFATQPTYV